MDDPPPRVLEMAREIRRGEADYAPHALYAASLGRADLYRHAMQEAGYVVPGDTNEAPAVCDVCGYDFGAPGPRHPSPQIANPYIESRRRESSDG